MSFETFNLHNKINTNIKAAGYTKPTPIQAEAIPLCLSGKDVVGLAQTGTGKTAAFVLPILQRLINRPRKTTRALIIAPTRELTEQTHQAIKQLGRATGLHCASIYGGNSIQPQISTLRRGVEIIAACPGRLLDHVERKTLSLADVEVLVLDEADRMFDMGFLPDIRKIIARLPATRQTLLFSATMPPELHRLVNQVQNNPVRVQIGDSTPATTVAHTFYRTEQDQKHDLLHDILTQMHTESVVVFTRTKARAQRLATRLDKGGVQAAALHGNLTQNKRQQALEGFRCGRYKVLVATDVAARGIDVSTISHVINYDIPDTVDAYTHRVGRTGRALRTGNAFSFITRDDESIARSLASMLGTKVRSSDGNPWPVQHKPAHAASRSRNNAKRAKTTRTQSSRRNKYSSRRPAQAAA